MNNIIYINSTVDARKRLTAKNDLSTFHYWGYQPRRGDKTYSHRGDRASIIVRSRMGGLDLAILRRVLRDLSRGYCRLYLVTQPDLIHALPLLKKLFPRIKMVTWLWTAEEAVRYGRACRCCEHLFCLTQGALDQLTEMGLGERASVQLLGAEPDFYLAREQQQIVYDACVVGLSGRDFGVVQQAMSASQMTVCTTREAIRFSGNYGGERAQSERFVVIEARSNADVLRMMHQSKVSWIPLFGGNPAPAGYTNLLESLLCGVPVVIADASTIPEELLALPGVWRYKTGDVASFVEVNRAAMESGAQQNYRDEVRRAAAPVLDGQRLEDAVRRYLDI